MTRTTKNPPLVTFSLFAYNQENFVKEAILSAFSQTYSPLEIILSDDCSTDSTFSIMEKMANEYTGPHKIILNKNPNNLGLIQHVNKVFTMANADIVVVSAGDDISYPERVSRTYELFSKSPDIISVSMNYQHMDMNGDLLTGKSHYKTGYYSLKDYTNRKLFPILGATRAYKRILFDTFPKLESSCGVEDSNIVFRSLLLGKIYHSEEIGIKYRIGLNSLSQNINHKLYNGIIEQRIKDLNFAKENGLINEDIYNPVMDIINLSKRKHSNLENFLSKNHNIKYFLFNILFSNDFTFIEKKMHFKGLIKKTMEIN